MSADDARDDDPVAAALTEGSPYERLRVQRISVFSWSLAEKLQRVGVVMLVLGVGVGALAFVSPNGATIPVDPGRTSTYASLVSLIALGTLALVALALSALAGFRERNEPLSVERAETMLVAEELCALVGFITAGTITVIAVGLCLLPYLGGDSVTRFVSSLARSPYAAIETAFPVLPRLIAPVAFVLAALCLLAGRRWQAQWTGS